MADLASFLTHTDAFVAALRSAGLVIGDANDPEEPFGWIGIEGKDPYIPYGVVYDYPGTAFRGPLGCPHDDATLMWQVMCVGASRAQASDMADRVNRAVVGVRLQVEGRWVDPVSADIGTGGLRRDDSVEPNVFIASPRFRALSSPKGTL